MNYERIYSELIFRAKNRSILAGHYTEKHHILPESMYPEFKKEKWNLVRLFPEEHLIAHLLLVKIYPKSFQMTKAAIMMYCVSGNQQRIRNKQYGWLKRKLSKEQSIKFSGVNNPNYGNKWSDELRELRSGENNPAYNHNGKFSIFSENYENRQGLTIEELELKKKETVQKISDTIKTKGSSNGRAKKINIYDTFDMVQFECYGSLRKTCNDYKLPFNALFKSQKAGGKRIYQVLGSNKSRLEKSGLIKYVGWYAKEVD